ncbi:hypothetical protein FGB62_24g230 [Gracilaria domingensis]|nr:hypothetical protein FGB62_24g230 [Gracilaria domingensis]
MPRRSRPHSFLPRRRRERQPEPPLPPPPSRPPELAGSFAEVRVADFVDVPPNRFAAAALPRQDKLRRPPSYDFSKPPGAPQRRARAPATVVTDPQYFGALPYPAPSDSSLHSSDSERSPHSIDSAVYVIDNSDHVSNLLSIVAPSKHCEPSSSQLISKLSPAFRRSFRVDDLCSDDTDLFEGHLEHLRFEDAPSDHAVTASCPTTSEPDEPSSRSSRSVTNVQPVFCPSPNPHVSFDVPITPYVSPRTESQCSLSSQSSIHAASLTDLCTIRSVESNDDLFRLHSRSQSPLITRVESSYSADNVLHSSRNLMCQNPASPTKYTFRPTYRHSSPHVSAAGLSLQEPASLQEPVSLPEPMSLFQAQRHTTPINPHTSNQQVCHRKSYSFSSLSSHTNSEPLTLAAFKKAVDIIDPRVVFSIAQSQSLAFAAAGLFRKKRDSEETFNSSSTEYYEDDYTRFLEKKHCLSPSRLIQHPYISKMINYDGWSLRSSKQDFRRDSSLSIPASDEDFFPAS